MRKSDLLYAFIYATKQGQHDKAEAIAMVLQDQNLLAALDGNAPPNMSKAQSREWLNSLPEAMLAKILQSANEKAFKP